jgi:hypothetical protein
MSASTVAAVGELLYSHRQLMPILEEHLKDNYGEVLPHLIMADVIRWMVAHRDTEWDTCQSVLEWMEREYVQGPADVRNLIAVSGVEMIPDPNCPGAELRNILGPALREVDPWNT